MKWNELFIPACCIMALDSYFLIQEKSVSVVNLVQLSVNVNLHKNGGTCVLMLQVALYFCVILFEIETAQIMIKRNGMSKTKRLLPVDKVCH